jgi:hypothetical protein
MWRIDVKRHALSGLRDRPSPLYSLKERDRELMKLETRMIDVQKRYDQQRDDYKDLLTRYRTLSQVTALRREEEGTCACVEARAERPHQASWGLCDVARALLTLFPTTVPKDAGAALVLLLQEHDKIRAEAQLQDTKTQADWKIERLIKDNRALELANTELRKELGDVKTENLEVSGLERPFAAAVKHDHSAGPGPVRTSIG